MKRLLVLSNALTAIVCLSVIYYRDSSPTVGLDVRAAAPNPVDAIKNPFLSADELPGIIADWPWEVDAPVEFCTVENAKLWAIAKYGIESVCPQDLGVPDVLRCDDPFCPTCKGISFDRCRLARIAAQNGQ